MAHKIAFFTELFKLDEDEEETDDPEDAALILRQFKPLPQPLRSKKKAILGRETPSLSSNASAVESLSSLVQSPSEPTRNPSRVSSSSASAVDASPSLVQSPSEPLRNPYRVSSSSTSGRAKLVNLAKVPPKRNGKRRRAGSLELLPDSQQIFKGLEFYFIPNNDISPARRFRIKKAVERGALWVREWRTDVTHIIADKTLTYKDIVSFLKLNSIPQNVSLVTEDYPAACISHQLVLNPNQFRYQVDGFEQRFRIEGLSCLTSSDVKMTSSYNGPTERVKPSGQPEIALRAIHVNTQSTLSEGFSQTVSPEWDSEFPKVSPLDTSDSENGGSAGAGSSAVLNAVVPKAPIRTERDALDEAIEEVAAFKDLPLDHDEDRELTEEASADETDEENSQNERPKARSKKRKLNNDQPWQQNFSCMHKHDGKDKARNPNSRTIEILQQMLEYYDRTNDHWRTLAYRKAISALRKHNTKVTSEEEACNIPFIGQRLAVKIEEIVRTDRLRRLENTSLEPHELTLQKFLKIYGVGLAQATKWINQGHRTLSDLMSKAHLTKNQRIGIEHYADFQARIPRAEVESHGNFVRTCIHNIDPTIQITIGGSYRRGAPDSGDVDFIITKPNCSMGTLRTIIFDTVLPALKKHNYIKAHLASSSSSSSSKVPNTSASGSGSGSKWHGAASLPSPPGLSPSPWRRIDFLLVPWSEMGAALLYFTGNDVFNRSIRLLARKKGMRLNQHGLFRDVMGRGRDGDGGAGRRTQGTLVEGRSEERIFEVLGVPFRRPEHRVC